VHFAFLKSSLFKSRLLFPTKTNVQTHIIPHFYLYSAILFVSLTTKMGNVFAPDKPLKEIVRENQRMIKKSIRELEKEIRSLETNEKKLIADIKKNAKLNQMVLLNFFV
jgi:hypothetical protein